MKFKLAIKVDKVAFTDGEGIETEVRGISLETDQEFPAGEYSDFLRSVVEVVQQYTTLNDEKFRDDEIPF